MTGSTKLKPIIPRKVTLDMKRSTWRQIDAVVSLFFGLQGYVDDKFTVSPYHKNQILQYFKNGYGGRARRRGCGQG
jgi:hypothetical protein